MCVGPYLQAGFIIAACSFMAYLLVFVENHIPVSDLINTKHFQVIDRARGQPPLPDLLLSPS